MQSSRTDGNHLNWFVWQLWRTGWYGFNMWNRDERWCLSDQMTEAEVIKRVHPWWDDVKNMKSDVTWECTSSEQVQEENEGVNWMTQVHLEHGKCSWSDACAYICKLCQNNGKIQLSTQQVNTQWIYMSFVCRLLQTVIPNCNY